MDETRGFIYFCIEVFTFGSNFNFTLFFQNVILGPLKKYSEFARAWNEILLIVP
jgi:hypothetical protein